MFEERAHICVLGNPLRRRDRRGPSERRPLFVQLLERLLGLLGRAKYGLRNSVWRRMVAEILAADRLHPLRPGRAHPDGLAGQLLRLVDDGSQLRRHAGMEIRVFPLLVGVSRQVLHGLLQRPDRPAARPLHPGRFRVAPRDRQHGLGLPGRDLARAHGGPKQRPAFQLAREPLHLLRGAGGNPELLPGEVAVPGMPGLESALTSGEGVQPLAQGDAQRARTLREHRKQLVQHAREVGARARVALARQRPLDERGNRRQRLEPRLERASTVEEGFRHEKTLTDPSDIAGLRPIVEAMGCPRRGGALNGAS